MRLWRGPKRRLFVIYAYMLNARAPTSVRPANVSLACRFVFNRRVFITIAASNYAPEQKLRARTNIVGQTIRVCARVRRSPSRKRPNTNELDETSIPRKPTQSSLRYCRCKLSRPRRSRANRIENVVVDETRIYSFPNDRPGSSPPLKCRQRATSVTRYTERSYA